jgi:type II restriction enzyme
MPRGQRNTRTALVLLSMCGLIPSRTWSEAAQNALGIRESMDWMVEHYPDIKKGRNDPTRYAENTRESVRRQSVHQLVAAGVLEANFDDPSRPVNSGDYSYRSTAIAIDLFRSYGSTSWDDALGSFYRALGALRERWAAERTFHRVPLELDGELVTLSAGKHSDVIAATVTDFAPIFAPSARVVYLGDTGQKWVVNRTQWLEELGITVDPHGKMPDVVLHDVDRDWLILIEAVTSHGPMNPKRVEELKHLLAGARPGLVFVTAFPDVDTFRKYAHDIAWETEVWIRETPTHLVHYNGERFLGPYDAAAWLSSAL